MKTNTKLVIALLSVGIAISCKQAQNENANNSEVATDSTSVISSSAAVQPKNSKRKFVRTADIKFKVKDVYRSTAAIEEATTKFGGFVTYTNLQSTINDEDKTQVSPDSTLVTTKYTVNNITIRVPNTQLDTVIKTIARQIGFLHYRVIKADDVTLQMLSNTMAQKRSITTEKRIAQQIDSRGKKLNQIMEAENQLDAKKEANDNKTLENLSLNNQISFSTLTLQIYQDETVQQALVPNEKSINAYRPNIGLQIWDAVKTGWYILEKIISFLVVLWPFFLIGFSSYMVYIRFIKKNNS